MFCNQFIMWCQRVTPHVSPYRLQERLGLVETIKLFVLHHQEMSSIDDYSLQTDE